jgi:endonuclease/exonuclease/phosphatase (EEP) superfamily protein YafD
MSIGDESRDRGVGTVPPMGDIGLREVRRRSERPRYLADRPGDPAPAPRRRGREAARVAAAWILVVPTAAWLGVRASGVGAGTWIETVIVVTPFVAAGSVVVLAIVAALRVRPAVLAAAVTCVGFGLVMAPVFAPGPHPSYPPRGPALRVMTVNVQFGLADVDRVVRLVEDEDVDVLGVQELTPAFDEALRAAGLEDLLPYGVVEPAGGGEGTGLYSRFRVRPVEDAITGRHNSPTGLMTVPGAPPLQVAVVHPTPPVGASGHGEWRETFHSLPRPGDPPLPIDGRLGPIETGDDSRVHLLIGDFNATVDQPTLRDLLADGYVDAAGAVGRGWVMTWRFRFTPPLAIDHVLVDEDTGVLGVAVHGVSGSDHRAVLATLHLPAA